MSSAKVQSHKDFQTKLPGIRANVISLVGTNLLATRVDNRTSRAKLAPTDQNQAETSSGGFDPLEIGAPTLTMRLW